MNDSDETTAEASNQRSIELEIEVPGTPEEVWRAIATGPGISSWYVPHEIEERPGGKGTAHFGPEPEMKVEGRVVEWDPPRRIILDGGQESESGLAFEWFVEAADGGSCVVRLVNSGFGTGGPWDEHYDAMTEGWKMFLSNLRLHLEHFNGQTASASLPVGFCTMDQTAAWTKLVTDLGLSTEIGLGDGISVRLNGVDDAPELVGDVVETTPTRVTLLLNNPAPGTALLAAEPGGEGSQMSI